MSDNLFDEKVDSKGLRTHCPKCSRRLSRKYSKGETCKGCGDRIEYDPFAELPYSDTNVPIYKTQAEIDDMLQEIGANEIVWGKIKVNKMNGYYLQANFKDGFRIYKEFPIPSYDNSQRNRQLMRVFYHWIKAIVTNIQFMGLSKIEALAGLIAYKDKNIGTYLSSDQIDNLLLEGGVEGQ